MPHEFKLRLHAPLRDAWLADPSAPLPEPPPPLEPEPEPEPQPTPPQSADTPHPAPPPADLWQSEIGRRLKEDRAHIEQALAALGRTVKTWHEQRAQDRAEWRRAAVELGVTLAARLLHDRIVSGDFPVETLIREMIGQVDTGHVTVYLHPDDLALLQERLEGQPLVDRAEGVALQPDPALGRGDCRVEAGDAIVLSQLEAQLAETRRRLLRSLGHAQA
jgi:hypothetical protein